MDNGTHDDPGNRMIAMTSPYSPLPAETLELPVHSVTDLGQRWRTLMGELGFGERLIWFSFVGSDRRMVKVLHQMEIPPEPQATARRRISSPCCAACSTRDPIPA